MKIIVLILVLFVAVVYSNVNGQIPDSARRKSDEIMHHIENKEYKKVKECFLDKVLASISDSALNESVNIGSKLIDQYGLPKYEEVRIIITPTSSFDKSIINKDRVVLKFFEYPFPVSAESTQEQKIILIGFVEEIAKDKIISLQVIDNH